MALSNTMSSVYRAILRQALKIVWQTKYLWFFGLFAVMLETDRVVNLISDRYPRVWEFSELTDYFRGGGAWPDFFGNARDFFSALNWGSGLLMALLVVLGIFLLWLAVTAQGALWHNIYRQYKKQKTDFGLALKTGHQNFWKLFFLNLLARVVLAVVWAVIGLPLAWLYIKTGSGWSQVIFVVFNFLVFVVLALIIYFLFRYAAISLVNKAMTVWQAITEAWQLFKKNWLVSVEMAIVMFLVDVATIMVLLIGMAVVFIPWVLIYALLLNLGLVGIGFWSLIILLISGVLWFLFVAAFSAALRHAAWTILYIRISEGQVFPKLMRLVAARTIEKLENKLE